MVKRERNKMVVIRKYLLPLFELVFLLILLNGCSAVRSNLGHIPVTEQELAVCRKMGIDEKLLRKMKANPLYKFTETELDRYLGYLQEMEPDLRKRIRHLARKALGQKYRIFLLGEFPFEIYDPDPLFSLKESDCVVFAEHIYAMALAHDWPSFFALLQRIRYKDGEIGMITRNHYTEADWDINNDWLLEDITKELAKDRVIETSTVIDRARFFKKYGIGQDILLDTCSWCYMPYQILPEVIDSLESGDFVNIVRGFEGGVWVGHVGLITRSDDGTVNMLHSTDPEVIEQPLMELHDTAEKLNENRRLHNEIVRKKNEKISRQNRNVKERGKGKIKSLLSTRAYFYGFKFFRLRNNPMEELLKRESPDAPAVKFRIDVQKFQRE